MFFSSFRRSVYRLSVRKN